MAGELFTEAAHQVSQALTEPDSDLREHRFRLAECLQTKAFSLFPIQGKIPVMYTPEIPGYHVRIGMPDGTFIITPKEDDCDRDRDEPSIETP